jgi:hypothetical protein
MDINRTWLSLSFLKFNKCDLYGPSAEKDAVRLIKALHPLLQPPSQLIYLSISTIIPPAQVSQHRFPEYNTSRFLSDSLLKTMPMKTLNRANVDIILSEYTSDLAANANPLPYFRPEIRKRHRLRDPSTS